MKNRLILLGRYGLLIIIALIFIFPIVFMLVSSLKPDEQLLRDSGSLLAFVPYGDLSFDNYIEAFRRVPIARFILNSVFITTTTTILALIVNSMAGFAIAVPRWKGKSIVLAVIIATLIVPFDTIAIPLLLIVSKLPWISFTGCESSAFVCLTTNWLDTYHVQIIPFIVGAFTIFLFVQFFRSLPYELVEAALIDGANWFQIYYRIYMPISGPVVATVTILTFLAKWGDYLWPIMVVQSEELRPVQIGVSYFFQLDVAWGEIMAYLSIITIPVLILYLSLQRAFIESIAASGVKG
ncbi:MAG: carbohydrate ABC transporter permease [Candidatus Promineifilaceae bacterium]|nr:carbohydrate ABC transporter permease [Anaerolineaceae bacterium]